MNRPADQSKDQANRTTNMIAMVLIFDFALFLIAGLICVMRPDIPGKFLNMENQVIMYIGYGLIIAAATTIIARKTIIEKGKRS